MFNSAGETLNEPNNKVVLGVFTIVQFALFYHWVSAYCVLSLMSACVCVCVESICRPNKSKNYERVFLWKWFDCWKRFSNCRTALKLKHPEKLRHFLRQTLKMSIWDGLGTLFSRKKWNPLARDFLVHLILWKRRYQRGNAGKPFHSLKVRFKVLFLRSENTKKDFLTSWKKFQILLSIF